MLRVATLGGAVAALSLATIHAQSPTQTPTDKHDTNLITTAEALPGVGPALGNNRITQADIEANVFTWTEIRRKGMEIFSTPFNFLDGLGDGPVNNADPFSFGGRPTMNQNGTFLRLNGLDSQTCLECHSILSNRVIPATFDVGGVGGVSATAFPGVITMNMSNGDMSGRLINPPFVFGSGGVEALAKEMTLDLQEIKETAGNNPNVVFPLVSKGCDFGTIEFDGFSFDLSNVVGVAHDLVVAPFGRKGDNQTIRVFDTGAMQFHHGMQPSEVVGVNFDDDGDGIVNEIIPGELSALHIFATSSPPPRVVGANRPGAIAGKAVFDSIGCADCHTPFLDTVSPILPIAFPEVHTNPLENVFWEIDLVDVGFDEQDTGVRVPLFSDLKLHVMSDDFADPSPPNDVKAATFITARLWGIADTAPYMHDGSAVTLTQAIELHGGEGQFAADNFAALTNLERVNLLRFLNTLRVPKKPNKGL